jgi:type I restriction enzyme S subunit
MSLMRIDDLFHFEKGILQSSKCTEGEFDFITASSEWKTHNEYTHDCEALVFAAAASGSLGRTHYVNGKFISSDLCFIITAKDPIKLPIDLKFYHMIFNEFKNDIVNSTKAGTSKEAIGMKAFGNYKLPYFDIDKQIVTKVQFVNMQHSKIDINSELTHQLDLIKQLRQAFLREAMQGKLVKSTNTNDTGQQLLAKIKAEKAKLIAEKKLKKEKVLSPISEDEIPFEIPEHWAWCRLGDLGSFRRGPFGSALTKGIFVKTGYKVYEQKNAIYDNHTLGEYYITSEKFKELKGFVVKPNDLIVSCSGATLGRIAEIPEGAEEGIINQALMRMTLFQSGITNSFFIRLFRSPYMQKKIFDKAWGSAIPNMVGLVEIKKILIPLPPLHDQEQIVAKLEELMAYCDGLEQSIKESQGYNEMLLQQVLREALQGEKV